jgi:hypothetical protein
MPSHNVSHKNLEVHDDASSKVVQLLQGKVDGEEVERPAQPHNLDAVQLPDLRIGGLQ